MSAGNDREFIDHQQKKEGGKAMKCPLLWLACLMSHRLVSQEDGDCLKEECAWWDKTFNQCSINGLEPTLEHIALSLRDLVKEMPKAVQFLQKP